MPYIGKQPTAIPLSGSDIVDDSIESADIKAGTIVDSDVNASAAIATSKVSGAVTSIASHGLATSATTDTTNAANIGSGTLPDARFPATLPASSGANLTALPAANLTGSIADARIPESAVTQHVTAVDLTPVTKDISLLALQNAINGNLSAYGLTNSWIEQFENSTYIENLSTVERNTTLGTSEYMSSTVISSGSSQSQIAQGTGTAIGDMTSGGGLSTAFDGTSYAYAHLVASSSGSVTEGWVGKDWGSGVTKIVDGFIHYSSSNDGTSANGYNSSGCTITLYGNSSNNTGTAVNLGGMTGLNFRSMSATYTKLTGLTTSTAYRYHWLKYGVGTSGQMFASEIKFYETPDTVTVNATGSFNSTDVVPQDTTNKSSVGLVMLYKDNAGTNTLNTDIVAKVRANTGQAYQTLSLAGAGTYSDSLKIAIAPAISVTAGQALSYEISFANQSGSKDARVYGVAMTY